MSLENLLPYLFILLGIFLECHGALKAIGLPKVQESRRTKETIKTMALLLIGAFSILVGVLALTNRA